MSLNKWTPGEDNLILKLAEGGVSYKAIAETTGRTVGSIRNRLTRLRNAPDPQPYRVVLKMNAETYMKFALAASRNEELERELKSAREFVYCTLDDYKRLYEMCESLIKAFKNHKNTKGHIEALEAEMAERFPCPF